jgi:hypothetical protein
MPEPTAPRRLSQSERRRANRYLPRPQTACRVAVATEEGIWPARIENLSRSNIGLRLKRGFEPGTLVGIEVLNHSMARTILAVVIRAEGARDQWTLGCEFASPLTNADMLAFCTPSR